LQAVSVSEFEALHWAVAPFPTWSDAVARMGVIDLTLPAKIVPAGCVTCCRLAGNREAGKLRI